MNKSESISYCAIEGDLREKLKDDMLSDEFVKKDISSLSHIVIELVEKNGLDLAMSFFNSAYQCLLFRDPDPIGLEDFMRKWEGGEFNFKDAIGDIISSNEFRDVSLRHRKISEAALKLALPFVTSENASEDVIAFLGDRLASSRSIT